MEDQSSNTIINVASSGLNWCDALQQSLEPNEKLLSCGVGLLPWLELSLMDLLRHVCYIENSSIAQNISSTAITNL
jgi:hypothetical protein